MTRAIAAKPASAKVESSHAPAPSLQATPAVHSAPAARLQGGSPLPPTLRERMEASFGERFENVRLHTDARAGQLATEQRAEAVTFNHHIAFGPGRYRPDTQTGDHLVAHELAHVAQQRRGGGGTIAARSLGSHPQEPAEVAAESAAETALRGERVASLGPAYTTRNRLMRRARGRLSPPSNPAPLHGLRGPAPVPRPQATRGRQTDVSADSSQTPTSAESTASQVKVEAPSRGPAEQEARQEQETDSLREQEREQSQESVESVEEPSRSGPAALAAEGAGAAVGATIVEPPDSETTADKRDEQRVVAENEQAGAAAQADEGDAAAAPEQEVEKQAPRRPQDDPGFRRVVRRTKQVSEQQAHNNAAEQKAAEAVAAAPAPANETEAAAAAAQVDKMAEQEPAPFDKAAFKAALVAKINQIAPQSLEDADDFKSRGQASQLKGAVIGEVEASKEGAAGPIRETAEETPDASAMTPRVVEPMPPTEPGPPPPEVGAAAAAPKPRSDTEVSLQAGVDQLDSRMEAARVTDETLLNSNEPQMIGAVEAKREHQQHAQDAPQAYRKDERGLLRSARNQAESEAETGTGSMYDTRGQQFSNVVDEQVGAKDSENTKQVALANKLQAIFDAAQADVKTRLETLDTDVNSTFDSGAETARNNFDSYVEREKEAYKDRRYSGIDGKARWVRDLLLPLPDEVNRIYEQGRDLYLGEMDSVIDSVAGLVETGLNDATTRVKKGRTDVETEIDQARQDGVTLSDDAIAGIQSQFDDLENEVKRFEDNTVDSLAKKYVENLQAVDARINEMQQEDRGLLGRAADALEGAIQTIEELRQLLLGVLAKAASVLDTIIADPIGFLGNLIAGVQAGLDAFVGNIGAHLKEGLMGWLFGAMASAGITMPESFDLKGILHLASQILGLTYANIRARAVRIVGEPIVQAMETTVEIFKVLMVDGIAGAWNWIKDTLGNLAETVLGTIKNWVIEKVVVAGIAWIVSLLNPASALVRAVKAIIDIVMFFINRGSQILALVNAVLDSVAAIASGAIGAMASAIEAALARALPVAISFLASLLGLGGVSTVIRETLEKIQAPINRAIDWLINKAVILAKAVGGVFGRQKPKDDSPETGDPEHDMKVTAGLAAIDAEEQKHLQQGEITREDAETVAATVKNRHTVFKSIVVVEGSGTWDYKYTACDGKKVGEPQKDADEIIQVDTIQKRPSFRSSTREAIPITAGQDRRHIEAWQVLHERMKLAINGKKVEYVARLLERLGAQYKPASITKDAVLAAAAQRLRDQFNSEANLWAGDSKDNQDKGRAFGAAKRRADKALTDGDKQAFEDALAVLEAMWRDDDPSGVKEGYQNVTKMTVRLLRKEFRLKWPNK